MIGILISVFRFPGISLARIRLLYLFSPHPMDQQRSSCCHNFQTVTSCYHRKVKPIGKLHIERISETVLLYLVRIAFPASLIGKGKSCS